MKNLVVHIDDQSTAFLAGIYDDLPARGTAVLWYSVPKEHEPNLLEDIQRRERVFILGHGTPHGPLGHDVNWSALAPALAKKTGNLYIWCMADEFVREHKLSGLACGMFLSEVREAELYGISATSEQVASSNSFFSKVVRVALAMNDLSLVRQMYRMDDNPVADFNRNRIHTFVDGVSTPEQYREPLENRLKWDVEKLKKYMGPWDGWADPYWNPRQAEAPAL